MRLKYLQMYVNIYIYNIKNEKTYSGYLRKYKKLLRLQ